MIEVNTGQCGPCRHFGEGHPDDDRLIQIGLKHEAPEDVVEECGHSRHAPLHLVVTPISDCTGFEPSPQTAEVTG